MARNIDQRGDAVREGESSDDVLQIEPLDLQALGCSEDGVDLDLTALLRCLLVRPGPGGKTWAQQIVERWIADAKNGNPKAIVDIIDRTDKRRTAEASATADLPPIDVETAGKILEIICGSGQVATSA